MSGWLNYCGRDIAHYHFVFGRKSREDSTQIERYNFRFNSLEDLTELLNADNKDIINVAGEDMLIMSFRREMLANAHRIYINPDCELFDQMGQE